MGVSKTQQLVDDLKALIKADARIKAGLPPAKARDEIPAARGVGLATAASKASGGGGGIASPLDETEGSRLYYAERYKTSTDGLFTIAWAPTMVTVFTDANGAEVEVWYADPDA